jgi:nicotinamide-nucleotide amidase
MFTADLLTRAGNTLTLLRARKLRLATAESCTGGLIAALLTEIAGSSDVVERGFVTYSNEAKAELLGVPMDLIRQHGAVSEEVARVMAEGALRHSHAQIGVSVTGVAGPGGGSAEKPVGLVHFACAAAGAQTIHARELFENAGRDDVRRLSVIRALELVSVQAERAALPP